MLTPDKLFTKIGLRSVPGHINIYTDFQGRYFQLMEDNDSYVVMTAMDVNDTFVRILYFEKLFPEEAMILIISHDIGVYLMEGLSMFETYNHYETFTKYVYQALSYDCGKEEILNLCKVYARAVQLGNNATCLSDICKEAIRIHNMMPIKSVKPELHRSLLRLPDVYYDFVYGVENNLASHPDIQDIYIEYLHAYPECNTVDLIIVSSMLNANSNVTTEYMHRIITYNNQQTSFNPSNKSKKKNEILRATDDHAWYIFSKIIDDQGYTFRQNNSLCFVDYQDSAICGGLLMWNKYKKGEAFVWNVVQSPACPKKIEDALNIHLEELARKAGAESVVVSRIHTN